MREKTYDILKNYTKLPVDDEKEIMSDLGLDSVAVFSMIGDIECEFDISIPNRRLRKIYTVGDLIDLVDSLI